MFYFLLVFLCILFLLHFSSNFPESKYNLNILKNFKQECLFYLFYRIVYIKSTKYFFKKNNTFYNLIFKSNFTSIENIKLFLKIIIKEMLSPSACYIKC